jgi:hypothetical protein
MKTIGNCEDIQLYTLGILRYIGDKDKSTMSQDPGHTGYPSGKVCVVSDSPIPPAKDMPSFK